jgi:intracellular septation protein A
VSGLCWGLWSTWTWDLYRVINVDLFAFFSMQTSSQISTICWRHFFFFHCIVLVFVKNHVSIGMWVYFRVFNSIPLINLSLSITVPCSFYYYYSVVHQTGTVAIPQAVACM